MKPATVRLATPPTGSRVWLHGLLAVLFLAACGGATSNPEAAEAEPDPLDTVTGEELYRRGMLLAGAGDFVRSEQYLAASLERGFSEERAMPALLNVCIRASRLNAALEYAQPYLARHPSQWQLRMLVASMHMGLGQPERAREELDRVLEDARPEEPAQAHYFLGVLYRDALDDLELSATHFRRYLALEPEGSHYDEARAALPAAERGVPERVEADEVPAAGTETDSSTPSGPVRIEAPVSEGAPVESAEAADEGVES